MNVSLTESTGTQLRIRIAFCFQHQAVIRAVIPFPDQVGHFKRVNVSFSFIGGKGAVIQDTVGKGRHIVMGQGSRCPAAEYFPQCPGKGAGGISCLCG